jgi:hypothetical protein
MKQRSERDVPMLPRLILERIPLAHKNASDQGHAHQRDGQHGEGSLYARVNKVSKWSGNQEPYGPPQARNECDASRRQERMDGCDPMFHGSTLKGMPLADAAATSQSRFQLETILLPGVRFSEPGHVDYGQEKISLQLRQQVAYFCEFKRTKRIRPVQMAGCVFRGATRRFG